MLTLEELHRRAEANPGRCAVCERKLPKPRKGGRPSIVCGVRLRKACRRAYQEAYRAAHSKSLMRRITRVERHPTRAGHMLAILACGHRKALTTGAFSSGRKTTKCQDCALPPAATARPMGSQRRVILFRKPPNSRSLSV